MKEDKTTPLEELLFVEHMGGLSESFSFDENGRLPSDLRKSQLFRGFRDGYLDFPNKYEIMPQWKQNLIEFFTGGDYFTAYELFYSAGQSCRKNGSPVKYHFIEIARA
ncbi:MAG: hypothetical protein U1B79_00520 [Candidatus Pacearchaeota archaeon]|nr:hypothetical protein [Nanoarchaeota archaeon]MDZ4226577.1 hypothetical protein [Candidatus Pacearchaeota archaeon]